MSIEQKIIKALNSLVIDLVQKNYDDILNDGRNGRLTKEEIIRSIGEYGGTLTVPPESAYLSNALNIIEIKNNLKYHVEFDLWIDDERSDLTLTCIVQIDNDKVTSIEIHDIHVL